MGTFACIGDCTLRLPVFPLWSPEASKPSRSHLLDASQVAAVSLEARIRNATTAATGDTRLALAWSRCFRGDDQGAQGEVQAVAKLGSRVAGQQTDDPHLDFARLMSEVHPFHILSAEWF